MAEASPWEECVSATASTTSHARTPSSTPRVHRSSAGPGTARSSTSRRTNAGCRCRATSCWQSSDSTEGSSTPDRSPTWWPMAESARSGCEAPSCATCPSRRKPASSAGSGPRAASSGRTAGSSAITRSATSPWPGMTRRTVSSTWPSGLSTGSHRRSVPRKC
jgi:hypothetical protein